MSCPVMHDQRSPAAENGANGGCPVMHGSGGAAVSSTNSSSHDQKVFEACREQLRAYNLCQTKEVGVDKSRSHCEAEALALRECELARRRREKATIKFEECIKKGGDSLQCLQESKIETKQ